MAVFNFNGRQRKHERELQDNAHLQRMAEMRAMQGWQSTENQADRAFRTSERIGAQGWQSIERGLDRTHATNERREGQTFQSTERGLDRTFARDERLGGEKFAAGENKKARKHATKSQKLNFKLSNKAVRERLAAEREDAEEKRKTGDLATYDYLKLAGSENPAVDLARSRVARMMLEADTSDFNRGKLSGRNPSEEGYLEGQAGIWGSRAAVQNNRNQTIEGMSLAPSIPLLTQGRVGAQLSDFETQIARNAAVQGMLRTNAAGLLMPQVEAANIRSSNTGKGRRPTLTEIEGIP